MAGLQDRIKGRKGESQMNTSLLLSPLPDCTDMSKLVPCHLCMIDCTPPSTCEPKEPFPHKLPLVKQLVTVMRNIKQKALVPSARWYQIIKPSNYTLFYREIENILLKGLFNTNKFGWAHCCMPVVPALGRLRR